MLEARDAYNTGEKNENGEMRKNGGKKGDVMMKITAGGITKKIELVNFTDI